MYLFDNPAVKICCITNNPLVKKKFPTSELYEVGIDELLMIVREKIIAGISFYHIHYMGIYALILVHIKVWFWMPVRCQLMLRVCDTYLQRTRM